MKVGDLVKPELTASLNWWKVGIIIEKGAFIGRFNVKILWSDGKLLLDRTEYLELVATGKSRFSESNSDAR